MPEVWHCRYLQYHPGFPHETEASINESLRVALVLRKMSPDFELGIFYFKPYPGNAIADQLLKEGYQVSAYHDAESAIADVKMQKPDLILMDVMLPGLNGAEAIKEIRKDPVNKNIPVIFLTGLISGRDGDLKDAGMHVDGLKYQTLGKPFEIKSGFCVLTSAIADSAS